MTAAENARKLMDLHNFAVYWDNQVLGDLEGSSLVVSMFCDDSAPPTNLLHTITGCIGVSQVISCGFNGPNGLQY